MCQRRRTIILLLLGALVVSATVAEPAYSSPVDQAWRAVRGVSARPGGHRPVVIDDTGWVQAYTGFEAGGGACGGIVNGYPENENYGTREKRTVNFRNGDVVNLARGSVTLSVRMANDSTPVPEPPKDVDVNGPVIRVDYASGAVFLQRRAPGVIAVNTSEDAPGPERKAFIRAGLPSVYLLQKGAFTEYLPPRADAVRIFKPVSAQLANVCDVVSKAEYRDNTVLVYDTQGIGDPIYTA